jgi:hypothetical protein
MTGNAQPIAIAGLRELSRGLRRMDSEFPKMLRLAANEAAQLVVDEAVPKIPRKTGAAAKSVKVASTRSAARVKAGSKRVPYFGFLEFGGRVGPRKSSKRPFIHEGRYLWPAIIHRREDIQQALADGLSEVAKSAGIEVS